MFCDGGRSVHSEATEKNDDLDKPRYKDPSGLKRQIMVLIRWFFFVVVVVRNMRCAWWEFNIWDYQDGCSRVLHSHAALLKNETQMSNK